MRTTVTLDADAEQLLRDAMHRRRTSFRRTLNDAICAALGGRQGATERARFEVRARPMGLRAGIDPTSLNKLADELEADAFVAKTQKPGR